MRLAHLVADYGAADLAFAEVRQRLALSVPDVHVHPTAVRPFDTFGAGFCIAQLALNDGPPDRLVLHNVTPRRDRKEARSANAGEPFCAARTADGVLVIGAHAGHCLSFLAPHVDEVRRLRIPDRGSQFRSRDLLPDAVAALAGGDTDVLGDVIDPASIAPVPASVVAYTDGYGNLKTTVTGPPAPNGQRIGVCIGDEEATAVVSDGTFSVPEGDLSFAPGSSGWAGVPFYELLLRGGSAAARFGFPPAGAAVELLVE